MNADQYIRKIARQLQCCGAKKREIVRQLREKVDHALEQGESIDEVIARMGTASAVADDINGNLPGKELKKFRQMRALCFVLPIAAVFVAAAVFLYRIFPRSVNIDDSQVFSRAQVEETMINTVELLDAGGYETVQQNATEQMKPYLAAREMEKLKESYSLDWGERQSIGAIYMSEMIQRGEHFVVGEITVNYRNIKVIYRLSYDQDMRLAGMYIRRVEEE